MAEKRCPAAAAAAAAGARRRSMTSHNYEQNVTAGATTSAGDQHAGDHGDEAAQFVMTSEQIAMTSETLRAVDAVKFIAAHLRTEDDYAEVRNEDHDLRISHGGPKHSRLATKRRN